MPDSLQPHGLQHTKLPILHYLPEFAQIHVHWVSDAIQPSHPLSPSSPSALSLSQHQGLFQWVGSLYQVAKALELQHQSSNEYLGLISFRIDWLDLLAVQGTLRSFLQHHNSKASVPRHSVFFMAQLSHTYMTTGKTIALIIWTFASNMISLLFNTLSRFVTAFLPRNKHLSWLQSLSAVTLEPKKRKSATASTFPLFVCHEVMELDAMIWFFECWVWNWCFYPLSPLKIRISFAMYSKHPQNISNMMLRISLSPKAGLYI